MSTIYNACQTSSDLAICSQKVCTESICKPCRRAFSIVRARRLPDRRRLQDCHGLGCEQVQSGQLLVSRSFTKTRNFLGKASLANHTLRYRNGRWRSQYIFDPSSGSLSGSLKVDVHYYEDGNVRLLTDKLVSASVSSSASATEIIKQVAMVEKKYQEDLNRAFNSLSEGAFKSLRRQLPVTRQKVEWDKISGYRVSL